MLGNYPPINQVTPPILLLLILVVLLIGEIRGWWRPLHRLYRRLLHQWTLFTNRMAEQLYRRGMPWRRVKAILALPCFLGVACLAFLAFISRSEQITVGLNQLQAEILAGLDEAVHLLTVLGNRLGLFEDFATYVSAQVLADIVSAIALFLLAGFLGLIFLGRFRQKLQSSADIRILGEQLNETDRQSGITTFFVNISNRTGDESAPRCRARLDLTEITWRDIADDPSVTPQHTVAELRPYTNYMSTHTLSFRLVWRGDHTRRTILSGDNAMLPVFQLIPPRNGVPQHFEVHCIDEDEESDMVTPNTGVCLHPLHYYGQIRIIPEHGKYSKADFTLKPDAAGSWTITA